MEWSGVEWRSRKSPKVVSSKEVRKLQFPEIFSQEALRATMPGNVVSAFKFTRIRTHDLHNIPKTSVPTDLSLKSIEQMSVLKLNKTHNTNEVGQWNVRHNYFIVLYHRLHVSTYIQIIFRPSFTGESIKCYTCWDPIMLTEVKYIKT